MHYNQQFAETQKNLKGKSLDELLQEITVDDDWDNEAKHILVGWFAVVTDLGIIGYFGEESEAYRFRLDYINRILND